MARSRNPSGVVASGLSSSDSTSPSERLFGSASPVFGFVMSAVGSSAKPRWAAANP